MVSEDSKPYNTVTRTTYGTAEENLSQWNAPNSVQSITEYQTWQYLPSNPILSLCHDGSQGKLKEWVNRSSFLNTYVNPTSIQNIKRGVKNDQDALEIFPYHANETDDQSDL